MVYETLDAQTSPNYLQTKKVPYFAYFMLLYFYSDARKGLHALMYKTNT